MDSNSAVKRVYSRLAPAIRPEDRCLPGLKTHAIQSAPAKEI
jgi:hypothetical protein